MKAIINNIEFEGTPAEFAEFLQLQTPKMACAEEPKIEGLPAGQSIKLPKERPQTQYLTNYNRKTGAKYSVLYQGKPIGTMSMSELSALLGKQRETLRYWFAKSPTIEYNGYRATMTERGRIRNSTKVKATDTKGNNRIYQSINEFCAKTHTSSNTFKSLRKRQPQSPWNINGYIVERIN